jgi:nucleotide-binding universal stress UspA family protein
MQTILVPLDGTLFSAQALRYAHTMARALEARIHLLHVWNCEERVLWTYRRAVGDEVDMRTRALRQAGIEVTAETTMGDPATAIVETARRLNVRMIVMVTHGYTGMQHWELGSVTDQVVLAADMPVLVVRSREGSSPVENYAVQRILVPLDGSTFSQHGLHCALDLASSLHANVHLLRVVKPHSVPVPVVAGENESLGEYRRLVLEGICKQANQELAGLSDELKPGAFEISWHVCVGYPAEQIVEEAVLQDTDLIVMATHGYTGVQRWALGSTADRVLHAATIPLLLVRPAA